MDHARFRRLLDACGADLRRWPASEREPARALLAASDEAKRAHRQAERLDLALADSAPAVSQASIDRVLGGIARLPPQHAPARPAPRSARLARNWASTALLGGMAVLGFAIGVIGLDFDEDVTAPSEFAAVLFSSDLTGRLGL